MDLRISCNTTLMQYASNFTELSRFVPDFVASERMKMMMSEKGLVFYVRIQLVRQLIQTY